MQTTITNGIKTIRVNDDLTYPIALISADEIIFSGGYSSNSNSYLYDIHKYSNTTAASAWWTMTPSRYDEGFSYMFYGSNGKCLNCKNFGTEYSSHEKYYGLRPVINLRSDILVSGGNGTFNTPYTVKLPNE